MQERNPRESEEQRDAVNHVLRFDPQHAEYRRQQIREGRLTDPAKAQRSKRDTELARRQVRVQMPMHLRQQAAAHAVLRGETLDARLPQLHQAEFGRDKEPVERNEQQRADKGEDLSQVKRLRQQKSSV